MSDSCIWPIVKTLFGAPTPGQGGPGSDGNEEGSTSPKGPALLNTYHQIVNVIFRTLVLPLSWNAVDVFYSPDWLAYISIMNVFVALNEAYPKKIFNKKVIFFYIITKSQ